MSVRPLLLVVPLLLSCPMLGCTFASYADVRTDNALRLRQIRPGMTKHQVLEIMGTETRRVCRGAPKPCLMTRTERVLSPYRIEASEASAEVLVEVLYYYTDVKVRDDEISDDELTPLVFVNEELLGWGWTFLRGVTQRYEGVHIKRP